MHRTLLIAALAASWLAAADVSAAELAEPGFTPGLYAHFEFGGGSAKRAAPAFSLAHGESAELALRTAPAGLRLDSPPPGAPAAESSNTGWIVVGALVVVAGVVIIASRNHGGGGGNGY
jgi:hypothetical protein